MSGLSPSSLQGLRTCLRPEYADVPGEHLEEVIAASMSDLPPPVAENFLNTLGSLGKVVAPVLQRAAPSIIQGATSGASVGGPWGALIGAGAGLASSALKGGKPTRPVAPMPGMAAPIPVPAPVAALPTGQPAAATLVSLMQNPSVLQALMSQALGTSGTPHVAAPTGTSLPRGAINSLLMQLLANASEGLAEADSMSEQSYLQDDSGEYLIDPASTEQQAAVVLSHLQPGGAAGFVLPHAEYVETAEWMADAEDDAEADPWPDSEESADDSIETVRFY